MDANRGHGKTYHFAHWQPEPEHIEWARGMVRLLKNHAQWGVPDTGDTYEIDHEQKTLDLIDGAINDWFFKIVQTFGEIGYTVRDKRGEKPFVFQLKGNVLIAPDEGPPTVLELGDEEE